jgi:plastocyanin
VTRLARAVVVCSLVGLHVFGGSTGASGAIARPVAVATISPSYYAPPVIVVAQGESLLLTQLDPVDRHDVVSRAVHRDRRPVFASARSLSFGEAQYVKGVDLLPPGTYPVTCSIHPFMFGQLFVEG